MSIIVTASTFCNQITPNYQLITLFLDFFNFFDFGGITTNHSLDNHFRKKYSRVTGQFENHQF